eukprot:scaffold1574_cov373-Prasinococcus_capsulatus_cf.AAC.18
MNLILLWSSGPPRGPWAPLGSSMSSASPATVSSSAFLPVGVDPVSGEHRSPEAGACSPALSSACRSRLMTAFGGDFSSHTLASSSARTPPQWLPNVFNRRTCAGSHTRSNGAQGRAGRFYAAQSAQQTWLSKLTRASLSNRCTADSGAKAYAPTPRVRGGTYGAAVSCQGHTSVACLRQCRHNAAAIKPEQALTGEAARFFARFRCRCRCMDACKAPLPTPKSGYTSCRNMPSEKSAPESLESPKCATAGCTRRQRHSKVVPPRTASTSSKRKPPRCTRCGKAGKLTAQLRRILRGRREHYRRSHGALRRGASTAPRSSAEAASASRPREGSQRHIGPTRMQAYSPQITLRGSYTGHARASQSVQMIRIHTLASALTNGSSRSPAARADGLESSTARILLDRPGSSLQCQVPRGAEPLHMYRRTLTPNNPLTPLRRSQRRPPLRSLWKLSRTKRPNRLATNRTNSVGKRVP